MDWKYLFLDSKGRIGQKDFWIAFLILFVSGFVLGLIPILGTLISIALIYPQVCVFSKRLHDFGKTGWLYLAPLAITVVLIIVMVIMGGAAFMANGGTAPTDGAAMAGLGVGFILIGLALLVVNIGFVLWVGLTPSEPGPNKYGTPQGSAVAGVF